MRKAYVVMGRTGEYSDRSEWAVCAYTKEDDAKAHMAKAQEYSDAWKAFKDTQEYVDLNWNEANERIKSANPMDPEFSCDYTGTDYWFVELELREAFTAPEVIQ
jgi:hypothetical protein